MNRDEELERYMKEKKEQDEKELTQKRKVKAEMVKQYLRSVYTNLVINMAAAQTANRDDDKKKMDSEELCRKALEIAKWGQLVWFEENPEDSPENVDDITLAPSMPVRY